MYSAGGEYFRRNGEPLCPGCYRTQFLLDLPTAAFVTTRQSRHRPGNCGRNLSIATSAFPRVTSDRSYRPNLTGLLALGTSMRRLPMTIEASPPDSLPVLDGLSLGKSIAPKRTDYGKSGFFSFGVPFDMAS